jgi:synaptojanin
MDESATYRFTQDVVHQIERSIHNPRSSPQLHRIHDDRILTTRTKTKVVCKYTSNVFTLWAGTWNVNAVKIPFNIEEMVAIGKNGTLTDMYAIALQEVDDPGIASISMGMYSNKQRWHDLLSSYFVTTHGLNELAFRSIGGTLLAVYVKPTYFKHISELSISTIPLGVFNIARNKGAVGVRFKLGKRTFCIVCAHLTAGENGYIDYHNRVNGYNRIATEMRFHTIPRGGGCRTNTCGMLNSDNVIFMGDLNFRIIPNEDLNRLKSTDTTHTDRAYNVIQQHQLNRLHEYDELLYAMTYDNVLSGFHEGVLSFKPTYKYTKKNDMYDTKTSRMPAWTDRILWKGDDVDLLQYNTKHTTGSDHKPLHAVIVFKNISSDGW